MKDPWLKTKLILERDSRQLRFEVPHDVFSTQRIDEGTLLLLDHLPLTSPERILDMGCGYGALGIPIAARYPEAKMVMVDRDLLAVKYSQINASENKLSNVEAYGSLGYRDLKTMSPLFDWILCNVPARIGDAFIQNLIDGAMRHLSREGCLRIVVIRDLGPTLEKLSKIRNWPMEEIIRGPRHIVYSVGHFVPDSAEENLQSLYLRDEVVINQTKLSRPFDLGGDDPKRLTQGLPLLFDALPRQDIPLKVFCARSGYGQIPIFCAQKWPLAKIVTSDRDLLGTAFTEINARNLGLTDQIEIREYADSSVAIEEGELFDLITVEWSPSAGPQYAESEIQTYLRHLQPTGQILLLCLEKIEKEWLKPLMLRSKSRFQLVAKREGYSVYRILGTVNRY